MGFLAPALPFLKAAAPIAAGFLGSRGGGSPAGSVTQTVAPPAFLNRPLEGAAGAAQTSFNQTNTPFGNLSPLSILGLTGLAQRGIQGSPLTGAAQDLNQRTLEGEFLQPDNAVFNRLADQTRTRLSSEFARGGRDISASLPARADELGNIQARLFQGERANQQQAINQSIPLAGTDFRDLSSILTAGQGFDAARQQPLDDFIQRLIGLSGASGTSQTQPFFRDRLTSGIGAAGAAANLFNSGLFGSFGGQPQQSPGVTLPPVDMLPPAGLPQGFGQPRPLGGK